MRSKLDDGFTLIESLIAVIFLVILASILGGVFLSWSPIRPSERTRLGEENLRVFAEENNLQAGSCTSRDSDGDGYISCPATKANGEQVTVLCAYQVGLLADTGCKIPAANQLLQQQN
jgi:prepilin-type N-terminal cleavage/methylation domain-containing protein